MSNINDKTTQYVVKNRSTDTVVYSVPELGVRRVFTPGEVKKISFAELEALSFAPGGKELMMQYLQIRSQKVLEELAMNPEQEYYMDVDQVVELIKTGSIDQWIDALNFAPAGVIELIKKLSTDLPLADYNKRQILKEKIGYDVDKALALIAAEKAEDAEETAAATATNPARRSAPIIDESAKGEDKPPVRRVASSN